MLLQQKWRVDYVADTTPVGIIKALWNDFCVINVSIPLMNKSFVNEIPIKEETTVTYDASSLSFWNMKPFYVKLIIFKLYK